MGCRAADGTESSYSGYGSIADGSVYDALNVVECSGVNGYSYGSIGTGGGEIMS